MTWITRLFRRRKQEEALEKELRFHLEQHVADLIAAGVDPAQARRQALKEFGGGDAVREACRDARGTRWAEDAVQDIRYALRALRQRPGFAAVALLTLALGTGATTLMYTVIHGTLFRPYAYRDPNGLIRLQEQTDWSTPQGNLWGFTYPNYLDCKRAVTALDMEAWSMERGTVSEPAPAEYVDGLEAAAGFFPMLGVKMALGRPFLPDEDRQGAAPVAIISYRFWRSHYGESPAALGSSLTFDAKPYNVIGVLPANFRLEDDQLDVFTLMGQDPGPALQRRNWHGVRAWARLRPGASLAQAKTQLATTGRRLAAAYPASNKGRTFIANWLRPDIGDAASTLWLLFGAVGLVLLLACANIASLLLARASAREREFAMRVALGAGRSRLVRQCLTESAVLAVCGGALGVVLAAFGLHPFIKFWPGDLPRAQEVYLDWRVLLFALGISIAAGMFFGLAPALRVPVRKLESALRGTAHTVAAGSRRLHAAFVAAEIAIAMILLVAAGTLGRTLLRVSALDPGVNLNNVLVARTALSPATLTNPDATRAAWKHLLDRARAVPGVESIAMVDTVPMREGDNPIPYTFSADEEKQSSENTNSATQFPLVLANSTSPDYLKVTGIPLREGRYFTDADIKGAPSVAVIDEVMAKQAFGSQDPIAKQLWLGIAPDPVTVIGVVGHVRQFGLASDDQSNLRAQLYYPFAQVPDTLVRRWSQLMSIVIRTQVEPRSVIIPLQRIVAGETGDQVLYQIDTFEELAAASIAQQRFLFVLLGVFAALALVLACVGIYGVLAFLTQERVPEIGVRMALGASAGEVKWMVLRQSLTMVVAGIAVGGTIAIVEGRSLAHLVDGVQPYQTPAFYTIMVAALLCAAMCASYLPARRASRIDPVRALRQE